MTSEGPAAQAVVRLSKSDGDVKSVVLVPWTNVGNNVSVDDRFWRAEGESVPQAVTAKPYGGGLWLSQ